MFYLKISSVTVEEQDKNRGKQIQKIQSDTNGYKRIQTDTNGYKWIQTDTDGYK